MNERDFCYWLRGFMEINGVGTKDDKEGIEPNQAMIIRKHLDLLFTEVVNIPSIWSERKEDIARAIVTNAEGLNDIEVNAKTKEVKYSPKYSPCLEPKRFC